MKKNKEEIMRKQIDISENEERYRKIARSHSLASKHQKLSENR